MNDFLPILKSVAEPVRAIGRRYQYGDELYSDLCRACVAHAERFPWAQTWCAGALIRKAHDLMVDELRRRAARAKAERTYLVGFDECRIDEPYDTLAEIRQVLKGAIDSLPATYRSAIRESLEAANRFDSPPKADVTHRTHLHRARRMLAEDTTLLEFVA